MKAGIVSWLLVLVTFQTQIAATSPDQTDLRETDGPPHAYFFIGAELLTFIDDVPYPALTVSGKRIFAKKDDTVEAVKLDAPIGLKLTPCVTNDFLGLEEPAITYHNSYAARRELRLWSELSYSQSASDAEIADLRTTIPGTPRDELLSQEEGYRDLIEDRIDEGRMHEDVNIDTVNLKFTVTPNADMNGVYVAIGISYDLPKGQSEDIQRGSRMAVHYLGKLSGSSSEAIRIRKTVAPFEPVNVKCELFFYKGEANPIAHTFSRKLRKLTETEASQVRELIH